MLGGLPPEAYLTIEGLEGLETVFLLILTQLAKIPRVYTQSRFNGLSQMTINGIETDTLVAIIEG